MAGDAWFGARSVVRVGLELNTGGASTTLAESRERNVAVRHHHVKENNISNTLPRKHSFMTQHVSRDNNATLFSFNLGKSNIYNLAPGNCSPGYREEPTAGQANYSSFTDLKGRGM
jgi:hypothetical protein